MNIKFVLLFILLPNMRAIASWMRNKDLNNTGVDDEVADALDYAVMKLEKWALMDSAPKPPASKR